MKYPANEPVVNGRAAIIYSDISLTSIKKGQYDELIKYLIEHDHVFEYSFDLEGEFNTHQYHLHIKDICWATNAKEMFEILEKCDYNDGGESQ